METTITSSAQDCGDATFAKGRTVPDCQRMQFLPKLFGGRLMLAGEMTVYTLMSSFCEAYNGGHWDFVEVPGAGYMRPSAPIPGEYAMTCPGNWFEGTVSADAAGIIVTLMALSHLSFKDNTDRCAESFYALRNFATRHREAYLIFKAID
jgi:hypothetical protein